MIYSKILGVGSYLPEKILSNADLEKIVDTSNEWILDRTGISERRIAADDETSMTLGYEASIKAIENSKISIDEIDMIIVATCTSDRFFPSTGCMLQEKLGISRNIPAFDVTAACSG
ncbi:MAG: 3-oxoacyl-ACP synthase, partial [Legionellales bacterium]|nr:3-oxoacyl-ACP synthase [Legionellales bacterium]